MVISFFITDELFEVMKSTESIDKFKKSIEEFEEQHTDRMSVISKRRRWLTIYAFMKVLF